jgi:hypothetical protein
MFVSKEEQAALFYDWSYQSYSTRLHSHNHYTGDYATLKVRIILQ